MLVVKSRTKLFVVGAALLRTTMAHGGGIQETICKEPHAVFFNQLGYTPNETKRITFLDHQYGSSCEVLNMRGELVLRAAIRELPSHPDYPFHLRECDISSLRDPGSYRIQLEHSSFRYSLAVRAEPLKDLLPASIKTFYYQRASLALAQDHAGKWARPAGHPDRNLRIRIEGESERRKDVPGGWYDAGDYGKYVVNAGISVGTLLLLAEHYPDAIGDDLNLPESGNRVSDLLDEIRYELEWLLSMQDEDGGVFFKVGAAQWPGFIMPHQDQQERLIIGKSTGSTLNLAAVAAHASRVFVRIDRRFAHRLLDAAENAWRWAKQNPQVDAPVYEGGGTGAYPDGLFQDEFLWAASQLARATKHSEYRHFLNHAIEASTLNNESEEAQWWRKTTAIAYLGLSRNTDSYILNRQMQAKVRQELINYAWRISNKARHEPFYIPYRGSEFIWGSNGGLANLGMILAEAYEISEEPAFLEALRAINHYLLGHNIHAISFVTGFGHRSVQAPHHRISGSDGIPNAIPGFIVGGPNIERPDAIFGVPYGPIQTGPLLYIDHEQSFGSNEVAINWSAAFSYLLAAVHHHAETPGKP